MSTSLKVAFAAGADAVVEVAEDAAEEDEEA